jgi:uncharacterized protein YutE (UPF0331/DUF86 family)
MLKATFVNKKLSSIEKDLERLEKYSSLNQEEILLNYEKQAIIERLIERVINQAIDINQHIIKSLASNKTPENYKETFLILADLGIYTIVTDELIRCECGRIADRANLKADG